MSGVNGIGDSITRFLGVAPDADDSTLLGLPGPGQGPTAILNALNDRLGELSEHPEGDSAQAGRVRDRLHAAAAALLAKEWATPAEKRVEPEAPSEDQARMAHAEAQLIRDARLTLAQFGGWNRTSMRMLVHLAQSRGVDASMVPWIVAEAARMGVARAGGGSAQAAGPSSGATRAAGPSRVVAPAQAVTSSQAAAGSSPEALAAPASSSPGAVGRAPSPARPGASIFEEKLRDEELQVQADPSTRLVKTTLLVMAGVLALLLAAGVVITLIISSSGGASQGGPIAETPTPPESVEPAPVPVEKPRPKPPAASELAEAEPGAVIRALAGAVEALDLDATVAQQSFAEASRGAARAWPRMAPDQLAAMQEQVVEFVYRASSAGDASAGAVRVALENLDQLAVDAKVAPERVAPALYSAGIAARLLAERDLPGSAAAELRAQLPVGDAVSLASGSFSAGALAGANALAAQLATKTPLSEASWKAWDAALGALGKADEAVAARVHLLALDAILAAPAAVTSDPGARPVIGLLVRTIQWRDGDESRRWLVRWLDSSKASSAGLALVMDALIEQSSAAGIDVTMRLAAAASPGQRAELRGRIAKAWGLAEAADQSETAKAWREATDRALGASEETPLKKLARALTLSRLSEAAELLASGDATAAATVLGDLDAPAAAALATKVRPGGDEAPPMDDWFTRYAAAEKNVPQRTTLLAEIKGDRLPAAVVETVLLEALRSPNLGVRDAAREIIRRRIITPEVAMALLEQLPLMARTRDNAELVALAVTDRLPPPRDPAWRASARRALVSRLLDLLTTDEQSLATEALARALADSYQARVDGVLPPENSAGTARSLPDLAASLRQRWRDRAIATAAGGPQPAMIAELDARYESRRLLARGVVQAFAADQCSAAEMMGASLRAEQPGLAEQVDQILGQLGDRRRQARSAFEQMEACEAAMLELWKLRLGGGAA